MGNYTNFFMALMGCISLNTLPASSHNYSKLWKQVATYQEKDLPQSALKSARTIFRKAMAANNKGEMIKACLFILQTNKTLSADSLQPNIKQLEKWTTTSNDSIEKAVLHSVLGCLYTENKGLGRYDKEEIKELPDDMSEWTMAMYLQKARQHFTASLSNISLLSRTSMTSYLPIIDKGNTDTYLGNDLLHVLGETAVMHLNEMQDTTFVRSFYRHLTNYYTGDGNKNGAVLAQIRLLDYEYDNRLLSEENYDKAIRQLITDNPTAETCAEAYIALSQKDEIWKGHRSEQLAFLRKGIAAYPKYIRVNVLKDKEAELLAPFLSIRNNRENYKNTPILPGKPFKLQVEWRNTGEATIRFYRIRNGYSDEMQAAFDNIHRNAKTGKSSKEAFLANYAEPKPFLSTTLALKGKAYETNDSTFDVPAIPAGCYMVEVTAKDVVENRSNYNLLSVSSLCTLEEDRLIDGQPLKEIRIVNAISGEPVPDASATFYYGKDRKETKTVQADKNGIVYSIPKSHKYRIIAPTDNYSMAKEFYNSYYRASDYNTAETHTVQLFTDRGIYRPGQTVKVAGIAYLQNADKTAVEAGKKLTVRLSDANSQQIAEKEVTTNDYGSFVAEFTLPSPTLPGWFTIKADGTSTNIKVEEYKRPTFDVTFEKLTAAYKAGDSISVVGTVRTYAGVPLQNAKVTYTISARQGFWRNGNDDLPKAISATTTTDNEGHFIVPVRLMNIPERQNYYYWYNYAITASVLSDAGETQEGTLTLPLSNSSVYIQIDGIATDGKFCKENNKPVTFNVRNLQNIPVDCRGTYTIRQKEKPENIVASGSFISNKTSIAPNFKKLPSGGYQLVATIKDKANGKSIEVTDTTNFTLYSQTDVRPPVKTDFWYEVVSDEMSDTYNIAPKRVELTTGKSSHSGWLWQDVAYKKAGEIRVGTSLKDVHLFYRLYNGEQCIEDKQLLINDSIVTFNYPYKQEYRKGLRATFAFVKDGQCYSQSTSINLVQPDKKLSMAWDTFRDKLVPGQKESWTLSIVRNDREKTDAEVLASMYDASLDKFYKKDWYINVRPWQYYSYSGRWTDFFINNNFPYLSPGFTKRTIYTYPPLSFSRLTLYPVSFQQSPFTLLRKSYRALSKATVAGSAQIQSRILVGSSSPLMAKDYAGLSENAVTDIESPMAPNVQTNEPATRTDFNETAFFYPQLTTDKDGQVTISFTLPDALTQWNFRAVAHTKDMLVGIKNDTITASKDFMIQPNLPRYTRTGDEASFPATLTNLTSHDIKGTARMQLLKPENMQVVYTESQNFTLQVGKNYGLNFKWTVTGKEPALICRITATSGNKSDGEQNWIPVLSNLEAVTESIPLAINGQTTKTYNLKNLFQKNTPDAQDRRLTVEFTSNPVWYAVQALPSMVETKEQDALSLSSAFYAETLAASIVAKYPTLKNRFDLWKQENGTGETLWSNLQKNQELKTILLNETPWVAEATSEAERKQRLTTLFDINALSFRTDETIRKLGELQQEDGGWSWYKGMKTSDYITLSVATQLARLQKLTGQKTKADELLAKATAYLDKQTKKEYNRLKEHKVKYSNSRLALQTLYIQALLGYLKNDECTTYFLDGWEKHPSSLNNEEKACCAVIMKAAGRTSVSEALLKSLMEHTVQTEELGRYFDKTSMSYSWEDNRIPTQVLAIEALKESGKHTQALNEMYQWLLKQKQTQAWANPVLSANSIYALLSGSANELEDKIPATITINGTPIKTDKELAGIGYIHNTYSSGNIVSQPSTLTIKTTTPGSGWGGVYASYTLPLEKILSSTTANDSVKEALSIRREFYIERTEAGKKVRYELDKTTAKVGDCLISRLVVKTDRDLEFVQIKDGRAACAEPSGSLSQYTFQNGIGYYEVHKDASTEYFCDRLDKGTYIFENTSYIDRSGSYMSGQASVQCSYAPEFISKAEPKRIEVK